MKKHLRYLLLIPMILSAAGCNKATNNTNKTPVDVVIISGQSNATGCSSAFCLSETFEMDKYEEYIEGYSDIQIAYDCWTKDWPASGITFYSQNISRKNNFVKVKTGQGNNPNNFGPEVGIAEATHEKYANKLFLIKYACGGSNLKDDWMTRNSPMYGRMIDYVKLQMQHLEEKGFAPTIKAFCWMQGEGDTYPGYWSVYQNSLRTFTNNLREDLRELAGNKELPFIDAGICVSSAWDYPEEVNAAKAAFAAESENNIFIDTMAEGLHTNREPSDNPDLCHFDSDSEIKLGHLFAEAFDQFLMK